MGLFVKKRDPISERSRALSQEIAALEDQIKKLDARLQRSGAAPKSESARSDLEPDQNTGPIPVSGSGGSSSVVPQSARIRPDDPIFEAIPLNRLEQEGDPQNTPGHFNELGVRKYDVPALFQKLKSQFHGPSTTNPKLVSYLAAGGIQGLRPLRYEKRVARNRFILLAFFLFLVLLGLLTVYIRR